MKNKNLNNFTMIRKPYAFMGRLDIDLSLSENPLGCSPKVFNVIKDKIDKVKHYPDPNCTELKKVLANRFRIPMENIVIGNGSEQLIDLISRALLFSGDEAIIPEVTFPLFENGVIIAGATPVFSGTKKDLSIDLEDIKKRISRSTQLIFLCNPNNPTGKIMNRKKLLRFIKEVRPIRVVVDEANIEFGGRSVVDEVNKLNNLIVLRTFSKAFGLAGLRVGVCFAPKDIVKILNSIRQPFAVNALAQECAIVAIRDEDFIKNTKKFMDNQREFLTKELRKRGFKVIESQSNNILAGADGLFGSLNDFVQSLNKNNVSVVSGSAFRGLGNQFIRISPRLPEINKKFLKVIDNLISSRKLPS